MRRRRHSAAIESCFKLGSKLNQRDVIAVKRTTSGMLKLIYPHGELAKKSVNEVLKYAFEGRRRAKEQLKKIGGMEFYSMM